VLIIVNAGVDFLSKKGFLAS